MRCAFKTGDLCDEKKSNGHRGTLTLSTLRVKKKVWHDNKNVSLLSRLSACVNVRQLRGVMCRGNDLGFGWE